MKHINTCAEKIFNLIISDAVCTLVTTAGYTMSLYCTRKSFCYLSSALLHYYFNMYGIQADINVKSAYL